jgi:Ca-activated chloride channel family protein
VTFESPVVLAALLLVPLGLLAYLAAQRRRTRYATRFTNVDVLAGVMPRVPAWRRHLPAAATLLALAALAVAVARPHASVAVPRERATIMLVTDVSISMDATDVEPSRFAAAQESARTFVDEVPDEVRLGLVAFDQAANMLSTPTREHAQVRGAIEALRTGPGTATGDALKEAVDAIRRDSAGQPERPPAAIVLLSDGKTTSGSDPLQAADEARRAGIPVYTVALGTDEGVVQLGLETIPVPPDRETLRQIARISGGRYFDAPDAGELGGIYETLGSRLGTEQERREVTAAFAAGGLLLLLVGGVMSLRWSGRLP